ncbi:class I ribonucleotide reductase maintenance protein YfaE [Pseudoalteromonas sp. G4]|uniref:class I ribonucleotide reductase maintenance protein YfaE n=1 Tax=Pseudoalteromonas sp. G4 TaxID=2992761 RepID=UPI00237ED2B2|nr:class I ribonucleotide reductase maintenance protein YfaE [Pseudoalteromonas sp. G4]MDE3270784.1 class I ribonucleotide reductase maintenance protein YfaE [Pseudoalteromonas sp. G4]
MSKVTIANTDQSLDFDSDQPNLLTFLENNNIEPQFHCREGFCGACRCKLVNGNVEYQQEPLAFVRKGEILLCCATPASDIEIDIPKF